MHEERDFKDPKYTGWRYSVFCLHDFTCGLCKKKGCKLEAHHIVRWADNHRLRYIISNGIPLCKECHQLVTGRETEYEDYFKKIVKQKLSDKRVKKRKKQKKEGREKKRQKQRNEQLLDEGNKKLKKRFIGNPRARF